MGRKTAGGTAGGGRSSSKIVFNKPSEPSFIRKLREQAGLKNPSHSEEEEDDDGKPSLDEEEPVVVVLKKGDLTAEEAKTEKEIRGAESEEGPSPSLPPPDGKIKFRKPVKRPSSSSSSSTSDSKVPQKAKKKTFQGFF